MESAASLNSPLSHLTSRAIGIQAGAWNERDIVRDAIRGGKVNLVVGETYPTGTSVADRTKVSVTADFLECGGLGFNTVNMTCNAGTTGENGLDTGSLAASTWYYLFFCSTSRGEKTCLLLSLSATAPATPSGYAWFRRIGCLRTNATAAPNTLFYRFWHRGNWWHWNEDVSTISGTEFTKYAATPAAAWTAQSLSTCVPPIRTIIRLGVSVDNGSGGSVYAGFYIRPTGFNYVSSGFGVMLGTLSWGWLWLPNSSTWGHGQIELPLSSSQSIDYYKPTVAFGLYMTVIAFYDDV